MPLFPRALALAIALGALSAPAAAQGYPTCAQARAIVLRQGAAVIRTAPNIYDRYVADRSYCQISEHAARVLTPTRDAPACFIGYVCKEGGRFEDF